MLQEKNMFKRKIYYFQIVGIIFYPCSGKEQRINNKKKNKSQETGKRDS